MMLVTRLNFFSSFKILTKRVENIHQNVRKISQKPVSSGFTLDFLSGQRQGVVTLGLNRPEVKNALSKNVVYELADVMESLKYDKNARVLIIHSLVKNVFCAGADLKERVTMPESEVGAFVSKIRQFAANLHDLPLPTIAAIDGYALGGGLEMALSCDLRISSSTAKMGLVETKLGIIPGGGGTQNLAWIVGPAVAKELIFSARVIDGDKAYEYGLVNHAVEQNETGNAAFLKSLEIAEEIANNGPIAVRLAKLAINKGLNVDLQSGLVFEQMCYAQTIGTKDRIEGLMAFKEKRPPKFTAE